MAISEIVLEISSFSCFIIRILYDEEIGLDCLKDSFNWTHGILKFC